MTYSMHQNLQSPHLTTKRYQNVSQKLYPLVGRVITVFVDSGGISGSGFTGLLMEVNADHITLLTQLPSAPKVEKLHSKRSSHRSKCTPKNEDRLGAYTLILTDHITAITYAYV